MLIKKAYHQNLLTFRFTFGLLIYKVLGSLASFLTVRDYTERLKTHQQAELRAPRYRKAMNAFLNEAYPLDEVHPLNGTMIDPGFRQMTIEFDAILRRSTSLGPRGDWWDIAGRQCLIAYASFHRHDVR